MNPQQKIDDLAIQYWNKKGKLKLLSGVMGAEQLEREQRSHARNREAEEAYVRKTAWGSTQGETDVSEADEMRQTVLGDINHPAPIIMPPQSNTLATLALLAAAALPIGLGGAALGYMLRPTPVVAPVTNKLQMPGFDDETVSLGLGRIENYKFDNGAE